LPSLTKIISAPDFRHLPVLSHRRILHPISEQKSLCAMKIMLLLILISLLLAAGFLLVYLWAARSGQFDDDYTPSVRILFDDAPPAEEDDTSATATK
jgi:cbb3-type cytochrome oxidase maturation protein